MKLGGLRITGALGVALVLTGCATTPPPVSDKVQAYYDDHATLKPLTSTPVQKFAIPVGRPTRVLFTGDSLTGGFYASTKAKAFPALVQATIGQVEVTQAALANQTLTTVSRVTNVPADLDLAVVELGTNDIAVPTPIKDFEAQYVALLGKIHTTSPKAQIVCVSTWSAAGKAYDDVISKACEAVTGRYVPVTAANASPVNHGPAGVVTEAGVSDTFHPNDTGHRAIADSILQALGI